MRRRRKRNPKQDVKPEIFIGEKGDANDPLVDLEKWLEEAKSRAPIPIINTDNLTEFFRKNNPQEEQD